MDRAPRRASTCCRSRDSWYATASRCSGTTNAASANRLETGTRPPTTICQAMRSRRSRTLRPRVTTPPDHAPWQVTARTAFYDPAPTLRQLKVPTLAVWGELDNNITAEKNKPAWDAALKAAGNRDYALVVLPKANHDMLEAKVGSNA